jgi:hypothetical protein
MPRLPGNVQPRLPRFPSDAICAVSRVDWAAPPPRFRERPCLPPDRRLQRQTCLVKKNLEHFRAGRVKSLKNA